MPLARRVSALFVRLVTLALLISSPRYVVGAPTLFNPLRSAATRLRTMASGDTAHHSELGAARGTNLSPDGMFAGVTVNLPTPEGQESPTFEGIGASRIFTPGPEEEQLGQAVARSQWIVADNPAEAYQSLRLQDTHLEVARNTFNGAARNVIETKTAFKQDAGSPYMWRSYHASVEWLMDAYIKALGELDRFRKVLKASKGASTSPLGKRIEAQLLERFTNEERARTEHLRGDFGWVKDEVKVYEDTAIEIQGQIGLLRGPEELDAKYRQVLGGRPSRIPINTEYQPLVTRAEYDAARRGYAS